MAAAIDKQRRDRAVLHFAGPWKPWQRTSFVPYAGEWWYFARQSPVYATIKAQHAAVHRQRRTLPNPVVLLARLAAARRFRSAKLKT